MAGHLKVEAEGLIQLMEEASGIVSVVRVNGARGGVCWGSRRCSMGSIGGLTSHGDGFAQTRRLVAWTQAYVRKGVFSPLAVEPSAETLNDVSLTLPNA